MTTEKETSKEVRPLTLRQIAVSHDKLKLYNNYDSKN